MNPIAFDAYSPVYQRVIDGVITAVALWLAFEVLFEGHISASAAVQMWGFLLAVPLARIAANELMHCYRTIWRYVGLQDVMVLASAYAAVSFTLLILRYASPDVDLRIPLGVIVIELLLSFSGAAAARVARRILYERSAAAKLIGNTGGRVLLIGAGRAGVNIANQLRANGNMHVVGFLDDDPKKVGLVVAGLKVLGPVSMLSAAAARQKIDRVVVCIALPPRQLLRRVWAMCELLGTTVKIVPTLGEILEQKNHLVNLKNVEMNDLLGRRPIEQFSDDPEIIAAYAGKRILITGAGGSIGSELALQLSKANPRALLLLDKDENGLNDTYSRLQNGARGQTSAAVADLRFSERLRGVLEGFRPDVVFHAAAHKHVHLMETNPCEAITNNVSGTRNLVEQSLAVGVSRFVQVSTDKAVNPTSVMGASKRICEMIVQQHGSHQKALFCCVRFGNVLGSRGSVVPIFQEQIQRGGPVTLTHPDAQRFLMTIPEAVSLLIQAGSLANNRDIFVLDMGAPVMIQKLAEDLIELSGLSLNRDIRIEITGLKPGEKVSEVLIEASSELHPTRIEKINAISTRVFNVPAFVNDIRALERSAWEGRSEEVYRHLAKLDIGYGSQLPSRPWPFSPRRVAAAAASSASSMLSPEPS
jgi:FlaA1/EpsC-like NDP-sugar epimerase